MRAGRFEGLLDPAPDPEPAGASLRWGPVRAEIEEARRGDDDALPRGVRTRELKRADWDRAAAPCREALAEKSKDLQAACWLVEAAARLDGPAAIAPGLGSLDAFCARWRGRRRRPCRVCAERRATWWPSRRPRSTRPSRPSHTA